MLIWNILIYKKFDEHTLVGCWDIPGLSCGYFGKLINKVESQVYRTAKTVESPEIEDHKKLKR